MAATTALRAEAPAAAKMAADMDAAVRLVHNEIALHDVELDALRAERVDGVIIDLRRNGGGSLSEATELTGAVAAGEASVAPGGAAPAFGESLLVYALSERTDR